MHPVSLPGHELLNHFDIQHFERETQTLSQSEVHIFNIGSIYFLWNSLSRLGVLAPLFPNLVKVDSRFLALPAVSRLQILRPSFDSALIVGLLWPSRCQKEATFVRDGPTQTDILDYDESR